MKARMNDIEAWCHDTLPELYDEGMFDSEEISEDVWDAVNEAMEVLAEGIDDEDERESLADTIVETSREGFRAHHAMILDAIVPLAPSEIRKICDRPQTAQHSADWYAQRRNRLTASEFSQILDGRRGALQRQKVAPVTEGTNRSFSCPVGIAQEDGNMNATTWGHRFESVVRDIYELELSGPGTVCDTLGRLTHKRIPWISASPDGIVVKGPLAGRLLEIKAPKSRQPDEFVPIEYYVQMQIQMEVCDLDVVDFVEAQFAQRPISAITSGDKEAIREARWKGRLQVRGTLENSESWSYVYSQPVEDLEDAKLPSCDKPLLEDTVWWLTGWFPRTVLRNKNWWQTIGLPNAELFWAEVLSLRETAPTTEHGWLGNNNHI